MAPWVSDLSLGHQCWGEPGRGAWAVLQPLYGGPRGGMRMLHTEARVAALPLQAQLTGCWGWVPGCRSPAPASQPPVLTLNSAPAARGSSTSACWSSCSTV